MRNYKGLLRFPFAMLRASAHRNDTENPYVIARSVSDEAISKN